MATERENERVREFRLEGAGLVVIGAALLVAFVGAFYLGRWYERQSIPVLDSVAVAADPLNEVDGDAGASDLETDLTFFDTLSGEGQQAEPRREAAPRTTPGAGSTEAEADRREPPARPAAETTDEPAGFYVQVFAGRNRESAENMVGRLESQSFRVRVESVRDGQGRLYKVRVGGYSTRPEADEAAGRLRETGYPTAWVVSPE